MCGFTSLAQKEAANWYFGQQAGLNFSNGSPVILTNGRTHNLVSSACISDGAGNLLFYSDGDTVYTSQHQVMANGILSVGYLSDYRPSLIVRQPGSQSLFYIFTGATFNSTMGINYSVVDLNLAGGQGSVTVKNQPLVSGPCSGNLTATRHCNGINTWLQVSDYQQNYFFEISAAGISSTPITLPVLYASLPQYVSKFSPNGKKFATTFFSGSLAVFDFDSSTGVLSNSCVVQQSQTMAGVISIEFSGDGSKLYFVNPPSSSQNQITVIKQMDLCAGSPSAIIASTYSMTITGQAFPLQLALDGKIYCPTQYSNFLNVINNPNIGGAGCNFVTAMQSVLPGDPKFALPNFSTEYLRQPVPAFTVAAPNAASAAACLTASFSLPAFPGGCAATSETVNSFSWDFGDPASGTANTSALSNPTHSYSSTGSYLVRLLLQYNCRVDTLKQIVQITRPCISVSSTSITCASLGSGTVTVTGSPGPFSYTWLPGMQTSSVATGLIPGSHTILVMDASSNTTHSTTVYLSPLIPLTGIVLNSSSVSCNGANTGTGSVTNLVGGSGNQSYLWTNGLLSFNTSSVASLSAGIWSITVTDALTACQINQSFLISQPSPLNLTLTASSPSACLGSSIVITATNSGGTPFGSGPAYTYTWANAPPSNSVVATQSVSGTYIYTLSSTDANSCTANNTIAVDFIQSPTLVVSNVSICPLAIGTLSASGASTYTWSTGTTSATGISFLDSPPVSQQYTLTGSALGCTSAVTASIILHPLPVPVINSNGPVCENAQFHFSASGGVSYYFSGPLSFTSSQQNNTITAVSLAHAGVYQVTVTSADGCTASVSSVLSVNVSPTISTAGSTVCTSQTLNLNAASFLGATFQWAGPLNFFSSQQNPSIPNPLIGNSGSYIVKVTSVFGCTASAAALANVIAPPSLAVALTSHSLCYQAFNGSPNTITLSAAGANTYTLFTPNVLGAVGPAGPSLSFSTSPPYASSLTLATATLVGSNGVCTSSLTSTFSVVPNPTVSINSYSPVICAGQNFTYTSAGANSYVWGPNTPGLTTYTSPVTVANPTVTSVYSVYGGSMGCNSPTQTTSITVYPLPVIAVTPVTPSICLNGKIILVAGGTGTSFQWSPSNGLNDVVGATVSAGPLLTQTYTVIASANNCTNSAQVTVNVLPLPKPTITSSKDKICLNETITLKGFGGIAYSWRIPGEAIYNGPELTLLVDRLHWSGDYTLTATDNMGCKNSTTKNIFVYPLPDGIVAGYKEQGCAPLCATYSFSGSNSASITATGWQIEKKSFNQKSFNYCLNEAGTYTLTALVYDALTTCTNKIDFPILVFQKPKADFIYSPLKPVENLDEVKFTNTSIGEEQNTWNWFFNDNKGYRTSSTNTNFLYTDAGQYRVAMVVGNKWHCADTVLKIISVESDFTIYVPNAFTPNNDGRNDIFLPIVRSVKNYHLWIFDRAGQRIFESADALTGWDGIYKGEPCKQDVYTYKIQLSTLFGESKVYTGHVTLLNSD